MKNTEYKNDLFLNDSYSMGIIITELFLFDININNEF